MRVPSALRSPTAWSALAIAGAALASTVAQYFIEKLPDKFQYLEGLAYFLCTFVALLISYHIGTRSVQNILRPHARNSFRRLASLYKSLSRIAYLIANSPTTKQEIVLVSKIESHIWEQIINADDALKTWRDIVPEQVDALWEELKQQPASSRILPDSAEESKNDTD